MLLIYLDNKEIVAVISTFKRKMLIVTFTKSDFKLINPMQDDPITSWLKLKTLQSWRYRSTKEARLIYSRKKIRHMWIHRFCMECILHVQAINIEMPTLYGQRQKQCLRKVVHQEEKTWDHIEKTLLKFYVPKNSQRTMFVFT